jgi:hypothetical protein
LDATGKTAPENATIIYDEYTGWYYLFTNQFAMDYTHTDCNIVYWTKDPNQWDPAHCAVVTDQKNNKDDWATGAIGMPSVVRVDKDTVAIIYDAQEGDSLAHVGRKLGLAYWKLPRLAEDGTPLDFEPQAGAEEELVGKDEIYVNDSDSAIIYTGVFTHDGGSPQNKMGDVHYTNVKGSIEYTFTGTGIKWIGEKVFNRGNAEVFIDGESQGIISQYDPGILYQQLIWKITGLPYGEHTIKIVNLSEYTCVDGFVIITAEPETEAPTEPITEAPTDPETEPATDPDDSDTDPAESDTHADPETETPTESDTTATTEETSGGCKSSLSLGTIGMLCTGLACAAALSKPNRKDD